MVNKLVISSIVASLLVISLVNAADIGTWAGYVYTSGSLGANGTYVTGHVDNASSASATTRIAGGEYDISVPAGFYSLSVECTGSQVNFKVCGINTNKYESCTSGPHYNGTTPNFNLSVTKLANAVSCSYSCACSGGYCCSGATQYTDGSGTGTCRASVCAAAETTTTTPGGGGGGGGGGGETTTIPSNVTTTAGTTTIPSNVTTTAGTTTTGTTTPTTIKSCTPEGKRCGGDYLECCSGLICKGNKCTKPKPQWLEISTSTGIIIGATVVIIISIISIVYFSLIRGKIL